MNDVILHHSETPVGTHLFEFDSITCMKKWERGQLKQVYTF